MRRPRHGRSQVPAVTRLLGLDIGGSTTRARLVADGRVIGEATAASASMTAAGPELADRALADLLSQLPDLTGTLDAVCAGAAGSVTAPDSRAFLQARLAPLTASGRVVIVDDASLVLPAAGLTDGIAIICGTGSIAVGSWRGRSSQAGGWGYLLGDEGSGYWVVRDALRTLLARQADGLPGGPLATALLRPAGVADLGELRAAFYRQPAPARWASLAPAVLECTDPAADRLCHDAAAALSELAAQAAARLGDPAGLPIVLAGGLLGVPGLRAAVTAALGATMPGSGVQSLSDPPVTGAVRLAAAAVAAAARPELGQAGGGPAPAAAATSVPPGRN